MRTGKGSAWSEIPHQGSRMRSALVRCWLPGLLLSGYALSAFPDDFRLLRISNADQIAVINHEGEDRVVVAGDQVGDYSVQSISDGTLVLQDAATDDLLHVTSTGTSVVTRAPPPTNEPPPITPVIQQ